MQLPNFEFVNRKYGGNGTRSILVHPMAATSMTRPCISMSEYAASQGYR